MPSKKPNFEDKLYGSFFEPSDDSIYGVDSVAFEELSAILRKNAIEEHLSNFTQYKLLEQLRNEIRKRNAGENLQ
jgi:hypothetical protein